MYGEKDDTGVRVREKKGHILVDMIFQKVTVPEFPLGHMTKLGDVSACSVVPVLRWMNCFLWSPTSPCCSALLPTHGWEPHLGCVGKKGPVRIKSWWTTMFSANNSAFAGCSLPLLVMHREVQGDQELGLRLGGAIPCRWEAILPQPLVTTVVPWR